MAASSQLDGVRALAAPAARAAGLVIEEVTVSPVGRRRLLRVVVDLPQDEVGGVGVDAVAVAAKGLSEALDASDVMGGTPYVLEVTSPGADRPLTERRHWSRARERLVQVTLVTGEVESGRLHEVDDDGIVVGERRLGWPDVSRGRVEVEFSRPDDAGTPEEDEDGDAPEAGEF